MESRKENNRNRRETKMSNKQQRTAWNLTKLCHELDIRRFTEPMSTTIYELAKDAKCVCVEPAKVKADASTYVIIPENTWNAACNLDKDEFGNYDSYTFRKEVTNMYYQGGMAHII